MLGDGEIKDKFIIKAKQASSSAIEKIEKAGGKIILPEKKIEENRKQGKTEQIIKQKEESNKSEKEKTLGNKEQSKKLTERKEEKEHHGIQKSA